jgi:secreted trypsin-like serine protease
VISAAHCLTNITVNQALVFIGGHDIRKLNDPYSRRHDVAQLIPHPDYTKENKQFSDADIGLIHLSKPAIYTDFIKPICLWPTDEVNQNMNIVERKGVVVGWGRDDSGEGAMTPKSIEIPVVSTLTCVFDDISHLKITSNRTLCVGDKNGKGPCHGDSGSGFVMKLNEKWVLRGIVSAGLPDPVTQTCDLNKHVVLSDTVKFMNWILSYIKLIQ